MCKQNVTGPPLQAGLPTLQRLTDPSLLVGTLLHKQLVFLSSLFLAGLWGGVGRDSRDGIPTHVTAAGNATGPGCFWKTEVKGTQLCLLSASRGSSEVTQEQ